MQSVQFSLVAFTIAGISVFAELDVIATCLLIVLHSEDAAHPNTNEP